MLSPCGILFRTKIMMGTMPEAFMRAYCTDSLGGPYTVDRQGSQWCSPALNTTTMSRCIQPRLQPRYNNRNCNPRNFSFRINKINRIPQHIPVKISIPAVKAYGILCCPLSRLGIIVPVPESGQLCVFVVQSSGEAKGDFQRCVAVVKNSAERVVPNRLDNCTIFRAWIKP